MPTYVCDLCRVLLEETPGSKKSIAYQDAWFEAFCSYFEEDPSYSSRYLVNRFLLGTKPWADKVTTACDASMSRQLDFFRQKPRDKEIAAKYGTDFEKFLSGYVKLSDAARMAKVIARLQEVGAVFSAKNLSVKEFAGEFSKQFADAMMNGRQKMEKEPAPDKLPAYLRKLQAAVNHLQASTAIDPKLLPCLMGVKQEAGDTPIETLDNQLYDKRFIMIHAEGGVGKSKLLMEYAKQITKKYNKEDKGSIRLPMYYPLSDLANKQITDQSKLIDYIAYYYNLNDDDCALLHIAFEKRQHSFILLLDGLNELSSIDHQEWLVKQLESLARQLYQESDKHLFVAVTSRTSNMIALARMHDISFSIYQLALTDEQKESFFERNHKARLIKLLKRNTLFWSALSPMYLQLCIGLPDGADQPTTITQLFYDRYHNRHSGGVGTEMTRALPMHGQALQVLSLYLLLPALCDQLQREQNLVLTQRDLFVRINKLYGFIKDSVMIRGLIPMIPMNIDFAPEEIVRYLVEDALLEVDASDRYTIHEQRRDYFAAYHQRNLCTMMRDTIDEDTWQDAVQTAFAAGFPFYVDIAQRKGDTQALFAMIARCENPSIFTNFADAMESIHQRKQSIEDTVCPSLKLERLEELRVFLICMQDFTRFTACQKLAFKAEMRICLAAICNDPNRWTLDWFVQYQTRMMIENCEHIRYLREEEVLDEGMRHAVALYSHVVHHSSEIRRLARNPLMFGFLNQAGKCVLRQVEDKTQAICVNGEISRETFQKLQDIVAEDYRTEAMKDIGDQTLRQKIIRQIEKLLSSPKEDLNAQYTLAHDLLMLSAYHSSGESLNLLGMMYEQIDVRDQAASADQRRDSIQKAFLHYYLSSRILHPRVQSYAVQKVVELCLKEGICIHEELPKTLYDIDNGWTHCFSDAEMINSVSTQKLLADYLLVMENCGMTSVKALYGLYAVSMSKDAFEYLKDACDAAAPQLDVIMQYLILLAKRPSMQLSENDENELRQKSTDAIRRLYERRRSIKRADSWYPSDRYLRQLCDKLSAPSRVSETDIWKFIKNTFDESFPEIRPYIHHSITVENTSTAKIRRQS